MDAEQFFYEYAGWSYDSKTETSEQGRRRGAQFLAEAEQWARGENITFSWEDDWTVRDHVAEFDTYEEGEPTTCEVCIAYSPDGEVLASLGCIDDADSNYRRVIMAELALEAKYEAEHVPSDAGTGGG